MFYNLHAEFIEQISHHLNQYKFKNKIPVH